MRHCDISPLSFAIILLAAGEGTRCDGILPKQFLPLTPIMNIWQCAYHQLQASLPDAAIIIVGNPHHQHIWALFPEITWIAGGATRAESVQAGLAALASNPPDYVLLHDAARPFVPSEVISRVVESAAQGATAIIPTIPATDTIKQAENGVVQCTLPRATLYHSQTPQAFHYATLMDIYQHHDATHPFTDEAELCERASIKVQMVEGAECLFKVTTKEDVARARGCYTHYHPRHDAQYQNVSRETISAMGYDVHRLMPHAPNTPHHAQQIRLGGIDIPHTHYLLGHSDADVVLHALTDALLGSIAAGDIGQHFPPSEPCYKGMDSCAFVRHALQLVHAKGGEVRHADLTIIGEQPKIAPHRLAMQHAIAILLDVPTNHVSIKATTTEGLGFTGRKEGIAAQALVSVRFYSSS